MPCINLSEYWTTLRFHLDFIFPSFSNLFWTEFFTPPSSFPVIRYPFLDQNALISIPCPRPNCLKTIPFTAAHTSTGYIWEHPPPPRQRAPSYEMNKKLRILWLVGSLFYDLDPQKQKINLWVLQKQTNKQKSQKLYGTRSANLGVHPSLLTLKQDRLQAPPPTIPQN